MFEIELLGLDIVFSEFVVLLLLLAKFLLLSKKNIFHLVLVLEHFLFELLNFLPLPHILETEIVTFVPEAVLLQLLQFDLVVQILNLGFEVQGLLPHLADLAVQRVDDPLQTFQLVGQLVGFGN